MTNEMEQLQPEAITNQPLPPLPNNSDETWDGEKQLHHAVSVTICETHTRDNWMTHLDYTFKDGVLECNRCPWGTRLPGYLKWMDGRLIDLRSDG